MKRAYPQYLAAGGEKLPPELLKVLFPVDYWDSDSAATRPSASSIRTWSPRSIAQESTFTADVKSAANAYGLMQLLPSTGRQYARTLKLPRTFSIGMLTDPETNIRMGTAYFADLDQAVRRRALRARELQRRASRVARWMPSGPGIDRDEFIDDIPYPGDAELREEDPRHGRGLPPPVRRRSRDGRRRSTTSPRRRAAATPAAPPKAAASAKPRARPPREEEAARRRRRRQPRRSATASRQLDACRSSPDRRRRRSSPSRSSAR